MPENIEEKKFKINNPTITTTYNPKPANIPRSFKKKMLDKPFPPCYNGNIIIEKERNGA